MANQPHNVPPPQGASGKDAELPPEMHAAAGMIAALVKGFAPHVSDEQAGAVALSSLAVQSGLGVILEDAVDEAKRQAYPYWGYKLVDGESGKTAGMAVCPKDLRHAQSADEIMHHATLIALVTSAPARALLASYGYRLEFVQSREIERSKIVVPT